MEVLKSLSMAGLPFLPSKPSQSLSLCTTSAIKNVNFSQIPSWVSLNSTSSSPKPHQNPQPNLENLHLLSLSKQGKLKEAHQFLIEMDSFGVFVNPYTYKCLIESCGKFNLLSDGKLLHKRLQTMIEEDPDCCFGNLLLQMYCDCGSLWDAQNLFDQMPDKDLDSWALLICGYVESGLLDKALWLFSQMWVLGVRPNGCIYLSLFGSFSGQSWLELGKQIHSLVIRTGLATNVMIDTAISNMYVKCGCLDSAKIAFEAMPMRNVVSWTGLMVGYTQARKQDEAIALFARMVMEGIELDEFVFSIVLKACSDLKDMKMGRQIHGYIVRFGLESVVSVGTPLGDFYSKCGSVVSARRAFEMISEPNDVSWSVIITGYSQTGKFEECLKAFKSLRSKGTTLNKFIYTSVFQVCSALADLNLGSQVHGDAIKRGLVSYLYGESSLVSMYSKCGRLEYAYRAFESIDKPDSVAWTAIICGCAYHGNASKALNLFKQMQAYGARPNAITFVAVLTACSHSGLVSEAKSYFDSMRGEYGVDPSIDHYDCMIDIYSRAGLLHEAFDLINTMPFEPDTMSWKSLLAGCWTHRNLELGEMASKNLLELDPDDTSGYILMFNLYMLFGKWENAARVRKLMSERNLRKEVSCSWICVKGKNHRFIVGDRHHPQTDMIYSKLNELDSSRVKDENELLTEEDVSFRLAERKGQLLDHSERLAIAFGLISTSSNSPILVFKNLRACKDCHEFAKHVSIVTRREIVVRDSTRFHHFNLGECSCKDYW